MDCENCDNCEIANCDCEKNTISQITQFSFLTIGRNRNITQFDFLEGRNCESFTVKIFTILPNIIFSGHILPIPAIESNISSSCDKNPASKN